MGLLDHLSALIDDPPPAYAFEISASGIAWAARPGGRKQQLQLGFQPLAEGVLAVSPIRDNVVDPELFAAAVSSLVPTNGSRRRREAALILPDFSTRVAILDFDSFPPKREEQLALVRFRLKKTVPFDIDAATVNFQVQRTPDRRVAAIVSACPTEVIARYEAPFRAAHFAPGFVTTSVLAMLDLVPPQGLTVVLKLAGRILTVAVCEARQPRLVRCVELSPEAGEIAPAMDDLMAVVFPTLAYTEDTIGRRPERILACGVGAGLDLLGEHLQTEFGIPVEPLRSPWGPAQPTNAGLLGWLQAQEAAK